jgi:hypothetical protein
MSRGIGIIGKIWNSSSINKRKELVKLFSSKRFDKTLFYDCEFRLLPKSMREHINETIMSKLK